MDRVAALKKVYLFKDLSDEDLERLAGIAEEHVLSSHSTLFTEGEAGDEFFAIVHGTAKVLKKNENGESEEVATLGTGSYFGEISFLTDDHERSATVETQEDTIVLGFKQRDMLKLLDRDDRLAHHVYRALARGLARRLTATTRDAAYFRALALHHK